MVDGVKLLLAEYSKFHGFQQEEKRVLSSQIAQLLSTSHKYLTPEEMDQVPRIYKYAQMLAKSTIKKVNNIKEIDLCFKSFFENHTYKMIDNPYNPIFLFSIDDIYWVITTDRDSIGLIKYVPWFTHIDWSDITSTVQWKSYGIIMYIAVHEYIRCFHWVSLRTEGSFASRFSPQVRNQLCAIWLADSYPQGHFIYTGTWGDYEAHLTWSFYDHRVYQRLLDNKLVTDKRVTFAE